MGVKFGVCFLLIRPVVGKKMICFEKKFSTSHTEQNPKYLYKEADLIKVPLK
jgi:hypothetical protein